MLSCAYNTKGVEGVSKSKVNKKETNELNNLFSQLDEYNQDYAILLLKVIFHTQSLTKKEYAKCKEI